MSQSKLILLLIVIAFVCITTPAKAQRADTSACANLMHAKLPDVRKISSELITAGSFTLPNEKPFNNLPVFCRVVILSAPAKDSNIYIEVWLPEGWNGRLLGTGNGGGAGAISYGPLSAGIRRGFAAANTDLGTSPDAFHVANYPDRWADFGYRATHEMSRIAKALIATYYGRAPKHSYFTGCSTGGAQGLSEAERYPNDFDGIISGAPANNRTHLHSEFLWNYRATHEVEGRSALPPSTLAFVTRSIISSCAGKDGGAPTDDFLTDPRSCKFSIASLARCSATTKTECVTPEQLAALELIYAGPENTRTGERIYAPLPFGAESSALGIAYQEDSSKLPKEQFYPFLWALGEQWSPSTFDFDVSQDLVDKRLSTILNANNPDLTAFAKRGGKLIMFTGTADPIVPFPDTVNFYERVIRFEGEHDVFSHSMSPLERTQEFFRYYIVPGMAHCGSRSGLNDIGQTIAADNDDLLYRLQSWVENGSIPQELPASAYVAAGNISKHRNLCPYPQFPRYNGGPPNIAASFSCVARRRGDVTAPAPRYLR